MTVVCWKWRPMLGYRSKFGPETVNTLRAMVRRHYPDPHEFACVTDEPAGIDQDIRIVPLWEEYRDIPSPHGGRNPSCYRRLRAFSPEIRQVFGERFVSLDLDCVITGDMRPVWNRPELDFIIWGDTGPRTLYNASMFLMTAGARSQVWETFDPARSPRLSMAAGHWGSDQGWISCCLGRGQKMWTQADGVYSFRTHLASKKALPADVRIAFFHGKGDPWDRHVQAQHPWVREHYRA